MIKRMPPNAPPAAEAPPAVDTSAVSSLFSTAQGDISSLFGTSSASSSSVAAPKKASKAAAPLPADTDFLFAGRCVVAKGLTAAAHLNGKDGTVLCFDSDKLRYEVDFGEEDGRKLLKRENLEPAEEIPGETKVVVIDNFDALAEFESIAVSQGVTEADFQGEMCIVDAVGNSFTWETFTPDAKFPIKLQFTRNGKQPPSSDDSGKRTDAKSAEKQQIVEEQKEAAAAKKRSKLAEAVKKKAAAARAGGSGGYRAKK